MTTHTVATPHQAQRVTGCDSTMIRAWDLLFGEPVDGERPVLFDAFVALTTRYSYFFAAQMQETLHHADWELTNSRDRVMAEQFMPHSCASSLAGRDQALAYLHEKPDGYVMIRLLYWTDPPIG